MKTIHGIVALALAVACVSGVTTAENKFVGVKRCMACHKIEKMGGLAYAVWEKSPHAMAFATLKSKAAEEIAKKRGLTKPASESPECLKCHVSGGGTAKNVDVSYKMEEGVTCEACHGAASGFIGLHNKKDDESKAKAKAAGLVVGDDVKKVCETCHNSGSPSFKGFKFAEAWAKIEHGGPKK